jgi:DNA-binding MarR family transcriptional regulator
LPDQVEATLALYRDAVRDCAVTNFRQAARVVTAHFDRQLRPAGLRATQLNLLMVIEAQPAGTITGLAEVMAMDRTTLTRNLKLLRDRGLVEKQRIALTQKGRRAAAAALPLWARAQRQVREGLGERRWVALLGELAATKDGLSRARKR